METLYDLLGALPDDDANGLRTAFRRAVKRAHPDVNPEDPDAGLKFRRIVHANEILGDAEQREAYDRLLESAHIEQQQAARRAVAEKVYKIASLVTALAGISAVTVGCYALFLQLSASALTPATSGLEGAREPTAIEVAGLAGEEAASPSGAPLETSGHPDVTNSMIAPTAESKPNDTADGRVGSSLDRTPKHGQKLASANVARSIILYRLRKITHAFAELAQARHSQRAHRPIVSSLFRQ